MNRRAGLLAATAFWTFLSGMPLSSLAQQPGRLFRIGILSPAERPNTKIFDAFREGLRELGYIEGQNISIEYRLAGGDFSRLPAMAGELVRLPVDVIVVDGGANVTQVAHDATRTIPIVGGVGSDPIAAGLATSLAHPGGNVTGDYAFGAELSTKRLQLLKEACPTISHMAAMRSSASAAAVRRAVEEAALALVWSFIP